MARDRKRAKRRRDRRGAGDASSDPARESQPVRADVPGALEHASGDVDEFDAALVRGAGGVPAAPDALEEQELGGGEIDIENDPQTLSEREIESEAQGEGDLTEAGAKQLAANGAGTATPEQASGAGLPHRGNRVVAFLRASWAELQRVQWPDRRQVFQATAVVLGFVVIAGAYLGLADFVAKEIVEVIL